MSRRQQTERRWCRDARRHGRRRFYGMLGARQQNFEARIKQRAAAAAAE
jgi:hypothetical protein